MLAVLTAAPAGAAAGPTSYSGTTSDGGSWVGDVPAHWNGTVLLYSHQFGPLQATDVPEAAARQPLLDLGYALVGSSYDPKGSRWALGSAVRDQFQALAAFKRDLPAAPKQVIAFGLSMGGLVSALEDQSSNNRIDGALTACGVVAGAVALNNYQLDGEYAIRQLLAGKKAIRLVHFVDPADGTRTGKKLDALTARAQRTPRGRARLALAMALLNVPTWALGQPMPAPNAYETQEQQQYAVEFTGSTTTIDNIESSRAYIEQAAGGNGSWTAGVNYAHLLTVSPYGPEARALYRKAGLNLDRDLSSLTRNATIKADAHAISWLQRTSVPTGRLQVPELDIHTIADQMAPVQQENAYSQVVTRTGSGKLLRQAFVRRQFHCNFTLPELVAGLRAVQRRIETRRWGSLTSPSRLQASAHAIPSGQAAYIAYTPGRLSGNNGSYDAESVGAASAHGADGAINYAQASNWLARPSRPRKKVDVFYLYPTSYVKMSATAPIISTINDPMMVAGAKESFAEQATAFDTIANVYAPFYRQADALTVLSSPLATQNKIITGTPTHDATAAFAYYIDHYNHGRPLILAGHSQGSDVLLFLLSGYLKHHPAVYRRMVAAYVIGYGVTRGYLAANPKLKFATEATDTGVIVSWNTEAPGLTITNPVVQPGALAIDPVTWTRSERPAPAKRSLGSLLLNAAGKLVKVDHYADARVDQRRGVVVCSTCSVSQYAPGSPFGFPRGIFHKHDYTFYYFDLRHNAAVRMQHYLDTHKVTHR
jgi:hypothetical protein